IGNKMKDAAEGNGEDTELINWRDIKEQLPTKLIGMEQEEVGGETVGAFGFNISQAEATYRDGDKKVDVSITDTGGLAGAMKAMTAWASLTIDREDSNGWERTSTYKGNKIYEKYNKRSERGEFNAIIANRFVVTVNGRNVDSKDFRKILDKLDVEDLL
ncbi:MAG: hypothetical protein AAGK97_17810, partial [Bacteroidota bacterium]